MTSARGLIRVSGDISIDSHLSLSRLIDSSLSPLPSRVTASPRLGDRRFSPFQRQRWYIVTAAAGHYDGGSDKCNGTSDDNDDGGDTI